MRTSDMFVLPSKEYVVVEYLHCKTRFLFLKIYFVDYIILPMLIGMTDIIKCMVIIFIL